MSILARIRSAVGSALGSALGLGTRAVDKGKTQGQVIPDLALWNQTRRALEVQTFRLSEDTAIVGLPGEIFTDLGLAIKAASPFKNTLVIELCNDNITYVPTRKAFAEGSYEIVNSRVAPGGGEILVETAVRLLKELKPK